MNNQALEKRNQGQHGNLVGIDGGKNSIAKLNMRELKELADVFIQSGAFTDVKQTAQAMVKIIAGQELGFSPIVSMTGIHFFQGKVAIGANLIASLIKDSGKYEYKILQHTSDVCEIAFYQHINGELKSLGTPVRYTRADAVAAGLMAKDNWKKYPMDMLFAACIRQGGRRYCADIFRGTAPDHDTDYDNEFNTSAMDDAAAQNVTVDAEEVEAVDLETGEVIEVEPVQEFTADHVDPSITAEPPPDNDLDPATEDLRSFVAELMSSLSASRQKDVLVGRPSVAKSNYDELMALKAVIEK